MIEDPMNYKAGIFYFNPKDSRIMVPKRYKLTGWTLNFASFYTYLLILGIIGVILIVSWLS
jgi:uncharacterized membrane protein